MKKLFQKSLLVAAGLLVGASAWADETKTSVYSNDFETSSDWTAKGKTDGWTANPGTTTANTFNSNVIGVGAGGGDMGLVSPSFSLAEDVKLVDVEMKFKMDACTSGKSSGIEFITSDVNINNGYVSAGTPFFGINASANGNGYWGSIKVGGNDHTSALNQTAGTYENNNLNRNTTGIVVLNVRFNFTSKIATYTLSKADGTSLVAATTVAFANANAATLDRIFIHAGKTYGGVTIDDVNVYSVAADDVAVTYTANFAESNGLSPEVTIYEDAAKTTTITNGLLEDAKTYFFTATAAGYYDYEGSFTVDGQNPTVEFTMSAKPTFTYNVYAVDADGVKLQEAPIATGSTYEGQSVTLKWSKYIKVADAWYYTSENEYKATATEEGTKNVKYEVANITDFYEMESLTRSGGAYLTEEDNSYSNGSRLRLSKGSLYSTPALSEGVYKLYIPVVNTNSSASEVYVYTRDANGTLSDKLYTHVAEKGNSEIVFLIHVPEGYSIAFNGNEGSINNNARMDYMSLTKISSMTIAGTFQGNWNINEGIAMTQSTEDPFIWTATLEDFAIEAKDYRYKAVANNQWEVWEIGNPNAEDKNQNYDFSNLGAGNYDLTFTANLKNNTVELEAVKQKQSFTVSYVNTDSKATLYAYTFNAEELGGWPGTEMTKSTEQVNGFDVYTITFEAYNAPKNIIFNDNEGGWQTGNLDFVNNSQYGIAWPTVNITDAGYATYCSPYALDFSEVDGLTAYVAKVNGSEVSCEEVTAVPANTGLLLKAAAGQYSVKPVTSVAATESALVGVLKDTQVAAGSFVLLNGSNGVGFYKTSQPFTVGANTAYLPAAAGEARTFIGFNGESTTTAIEGVAAAQESVVVYNLKGQRVAQPTKGLYIVNGKKVVLK